MVASTTSHSSSAFDRFSRRSKPSVVINLNSQQPSMTNSYSTLDTIKGEVIVMSDSDIRFEDIFITFEGTSKTVIERPGIAGPSVDRYSAFHTFLRLIQPIDESQYPQPRNIEMGRRYTFPFTFVVPERLLPNSCCHKHNHQQVHAAHTLLPPSLGDPVLAENGSKLLDDMGPGVAQIQYAVRAQLSKASSVDDSPKVFVDAKQKVLIIPATDEAPPLNILDDNEEYCMRKEKDVKKGALRGKIGRIVMAAAQPKALRIPASAAADAAGSEECVPTTMATVHLRFDPVNEDQQPPRLGKLWGKLKVNTFFGTEPWNDIPSKTSALAWALNQRVYTKTISLATRCVASATWQKHSSTTPCSSAPPSLHRRDSIQSTSSVESLPGPTAGYTGDTYYTTSVLVPINLPKTRTYVPTFHSCLTSRTYTLEMSLSYHTPNANLIAPTLAIRVPIQVSTTKSLANACAVRRQPNRVRNTEDEYFTPRRVAPPQTHCIERSQLLVTGVRRGQSDPFFSAVPSTSALAPPEYSNESSAFAKKPNQTVVGNTC
ncbi:hypothetical protein PABG_06857 [Paracoccidioides brasiliensis Pb03]|nr:hypothetical protein PABG_06857 [Paracoccidioides brasiliensis Pb03]